MKNLTFRIGVSTFLFLLMVSVGSAQISWKKPNVKEDRAYFAKKWIPVSKVVNSDTLQAKLNLGYPIFNHAGAGMYFIPEYARMYLAFLRMPLGKQDYRMMDAEGGLTYYPEEKVFRIGPEACLLGDEKRGNIVTYSPETQQLSGSGIFALPLRFGQAGPRIETAGTWVQTDGPINIETNLVHAIQLPHLHKKGLALLGERFKLKTLADTPANWQEETTAIAMAELLDLGQKDHSLSQEWNEELASVASLSELNLQDKMDRTLVLGKVNWKYDNDTRSLWSQEEVEVLTLGGKDIHRVVNAKLEYTYSSPNGAGIFPSDTLTIFLETPGGENWVYFRCFDSRVETCSMEWKPTSGKKTDYNQCLKAKNNSKKGATSPGYSVVTSQEKDQFLQHFLTQYVVSN